MAISDEVEQVLVRLEDGKGLWRELELRGTKLTQRTPPIDGVAPESSTRFENFAEAKDQLAFLVGRYLKQGLKEVSRTTGRVSRESTGSAHGVTSHPEYEAACLAAPGDVRPWQIYADWLQEHGDVRGELAGLFLGDEQDEGWRKLEEERDSLLGPHSEQELSNLVVTHGFIAGATLKRASQQSETVLSALTSDFLGRPAARFVTALKFGLAGHRQLNDWTATVKALCDTAQAKQLRKLEFNDFELETWELTRVGYGDFSPLWAALPALEHFHLRAGPSGKLGRVKHEKLKTFIRESAGLTRRELEVIVNADCPLLERLDVWLGVGNEADASADQLVPLFAGERLPRLTHLGLVNSQLSVDLVRELASSRLAQRLRVLDLSKGELTDAEVDALVRLAPKLAHLQLDLSENFLSERLEEVRRALPRAVLKNQRTEAERYDPAGE